MFLSFNEQFLVDEWGPFVLEQHIAMLVEGVDADFLLLPCPQLPVRLLLHVALQVVPLRVTARVELVLQELQVCFLLPVCL